MPNLIPSESKEFSSYLGDLELFYYCEDKMHCFYLDNKKVYILAATTSEENRFLSNKPQRNTYCVKEKSSSC